MATIELFRQCPLQKRFANELFNKEIFHVLRVTTHEKNQMIHVEAIHVHSNGSRFQDEIEFKVFTPERMIGILLRQESQGFKIRKINGVPFDGTYEDAFLILLEQAEHDLQKALAYENESKRAAQRLEVL